MKEYYGTHQVSQILHCSMRTVTKWFDKGILKGYRLPSAGGQYAGPRRISGESLSEFIQINHLPFSLEEKPANGVDNAGEKLCYTLEE